MRVRFHWLIMFSIFTIPITGFGCEPILPLTQLLSGGTLASPLFLTQSLVCLAVAVTIKSAAFAFLEKRLLWRKAVSHMVLANVLSTIPGVLVGALTSSMSGFMLAIPIVYILGKMVERRLSLLYGPEQKHWWIFGGSSALAFMGFFFLSVVLFEVAGTQLGKGSYTSYWAYKFFFVTLVASTGILISTVVEESVIARLSRKSNGNSSFFTSVWRANYITLCFVLLVAALQILPRRLAAPHFIVSWLHSLVSLLT